MSHSWRNNVKDVFLSLLYKYAGMKNFELQKRVRAQRIKKGISQEELADQSRLSLRTIQRIENGETAPRGDTLKRLAVALQVSPEELIDWQLQEDNNLLTVLNLSQLGFLAFPLLGVIIPLIIWILHKNKIKNVDPVGQSILNFQISWSLFLFSAYALGLLIIVIQREVSPLLFHAYIIIVGGLYLYNLILIINNTIGYTKRNKVWYFPAIKFLR